MILPGGGYINRAAHEGESYAYFLNEVGMDAFVLQYRVSPYRFPIELLDARRSIRYIRANAEKFGINPSKIGIMGSSAGGHLAEITSLYSGKIDGEGYDELDEVSYKPNAQILCYPVTDFEKYRKIFKGMLPHIWGVSTFSSYSKKLEHVDFTVTYDAKEDFIHKRLVREKRRGKVERLSATSSRFSIDVYDISELIPWIRTFICRITELNFSNKELEKQFWDDIDAMYKLYDMEGGGEE